MRYWKYTTIQLVVLAQPIEVLKEKKNRKTTLILLRFEYNFTF
jgi:hypothetical protein